MTIRELLQIEIWSKRTTRKLLQGFGLGFGIVVLAASSLYWYETRWLSSGERRAARVALVEIDAMQSLDSLSDQAFQARCDDAKARIEGAKEAAVTLHDSNVASALDGYLGTINVNRTNIRMQELMRARHVVLKHPDPKLDEELQSNGIGVRDFLRMQLHTALD